MAAKSLMALYFSLAKSARVKSKADDRVKSKADDMVKKRLTG